MSVAVTELPGGDSLAGMDVHCEISGPAGGNKVRES